MNRSSKFEWDEVIGAVQTGKGSRFGVSIHRRSNGFFLRFLDLETRDLAVGRIRGGAVQHGFMSWEHARKRAEDVDGGRA